MSCEDLPTQSFVIVRFHDHQHLIGFEMFEGEVLVLCPLHVTDVGTDQSTEDRAPCGSRQSDAQDPPDGEARNHRQRQHDSPEKPDRSADGSAGAEIDEQLAIGVAFEGDVLTSPHGHAEAVATESGGDEIGDGLFGLVSSREDRCDVDVS